MSQQTSVAAPIRVRFTDTAPPGSEVHFFASETRNPLSAWKYARGDTRLPEPTKPDADGRIVAYLDADKSYDVEIVHPDGRRRLLTDPAVDAVEVAKYDDSALWGAVTELKQWLSELKTGETWRAAAISDLSTEVDALANSPTVQDYDDSALRTEIAALKQSVAELLAQAPYDDTELRELFVKRLADQDDVIEAQGIEITKLAKEVGGLKARIAALEGGSPEAFIRSKMRPNETFEQAREWLHSRFEVLYNKGRNRPLQGDELDEYNELSQGLGKG